MTKERLNIAAWLSITSAVIAIPIFVLSVFLASRSGTGQKLLEILLQLISVGIFVFIFSSLRQLLNTRFDFYGTDTLINILIWVNIGATVLTIFTALLPSLKTPVRILDILLLIALGLIFIVFAIKLLRLPDSLFGMLKHFSYLSIASGFCFATILLIPLGLLANAVADIVLGVIFFRAAEDAEIESA
jgi:hypothetical protein